MNKKKLIEAKKLLQNKLRLVENALDKMEQGRMQELAGVKKEYYYPNDPQHDDYNYEAEGRIIEDVLDSIKSYVEEAGEDPNGNYYKEAEKIIQDIADGKGSYGYPAGSYENSLMRYQSLWNDVLEQSDAYPIDVDKLAKAIVNSVI